MKVSATLTVTKKDLLAKLQETRDKIAETYLYAEAEVATAILNGSTEEELRNAVAAWYADVADGLRSGRYLLGSKGAPTRGTEYVPTRPKMHDILVDESTFEYYRYNNYYALNLTILEETLPAMWAERDRILDSLDSQIDLISMSSSDEVQIDSLVYISITSLNTYNVRYVQF